MGLLLFSLGAVRTSRCALSPFLSSCDFLERGRKGHGVEPSVPTGPTLGRHDVWHARMSHTLLPRVTSSRGSLPRMCLQTLLTVNLEKINL